MKCYSISEIYNNIHLNNERPPEDCFIKLQFKGYLSFAYSANRGLGHKVTDKPTQDDICGDLYTGKEFYTIVDEGSIINYDGTLGEVFVDGYASNLGLVHADFSQGNFMVDGETWLQLCQKHEVLVEWCNK